MTERQLAPRLARLDALAGRRDDLAGVAELARVEERAQAAHLVEIGLEKLAYMSSLFSEADLDEMRRLRALFDPRALCNPGKVVPAPGQCVETGVARRKLPVGH